MMKLAVCLVLVCGAVGALAQREVHPCTGRTGGFAADLNNCRQFWRCSERPPTPGRCDSDQFFNDERQECVYPQYSNCFRCDRNTAWRLSSVRRSCQQFTRCFFGRGSLHACGNGLWFDDRNDVRNCNRRPVSGSCHLSDDNASSNVEVVTCPNTQITRPLYLRVRNSCQRWVTLFRQHTHFWVINLPFDCCCSYHVCTRANGRAETRTCPNDLHFNLSTEQCDLPERAGCDTVCIQMLPPAWILIIQIIIFCRMFCRLASRGQSNDAHSHRPSRTNALLIVHLAPPSGCVHVKALFRRLWPVLMGLSSITKFATATHGRMAPDAGPRTIAICDHRKIISVWFQAMKQLPDVKCAINQ